MIRFYSCVLIYFTFLLFPYLQYDIYVFFTNDIQWNVILHSKFRQLYVFWFLLVPSNLCKPGVMKAIELLSAHKLMVELRCRPKVHQDK